MDTTSLYYFSEVAKDLHITRTANRLFMSQQTLSNHIMRLEEYYGVKLLERKPSLSLTYAGEFVLQFAELLNRENTNLKDILADIQEEERGLIRFGASTMRMSRCLPDILPEFSSHFPNVEIRITDTDSRRLEQLILTGELDLAIALYEDSVPDISRMPLLTDQIYVCMTDSLLEQYYSGDLARLKNEAKTGASLKDFSRLPFCILDNRMGKNIRKCFDEAGVSPRIYTSSAYVQITNSIGTKGLAAFFATRTSLLNQNSSMPEDLNIFPLCYHEKPLVQNISLIHHKDRYLSRYSQYFISLIQEYFKNVEALSVEELVHPML